MKRTCVRLSALFVVFALAVPGFYGAAFADSPVRVINVCVLNDKDDPASPKIIKDALANVFREYEDKVGIRFEVSTLAVYEGGLDVFPIDNDRFIKSVCGKNDEVRIVFTDYQLIAWIKGEGLGKIAGLSDEANGIVVIFGTGERFWFRDFAGNPALETLVKHEIGHIFGLEHTKDRTSFMFTPSNKSFGQWTEEMLELLKKNKNKKWD